MDENRKMMMDISDTSVSEPEDATTLVDVDKIMCFDVNSIDPHIFSHISEKSCRNCLLFAFDDYSASIKQNGGFKENLTNTVKWLHYNNLKIIEDNNTANIHMPLSFSDAIYTCKILNSEIPNNFLIKRPDSSTQKFIPKKHLLLYNRI
jgi:hypothetical protein